MAENTDSIIKQARKAFYENSALTRSNRYRIEFKEGGFKIGRPFMLRSQDDNFSVWVDGNRAEDFKVEQVKAFKLLPQFESPPTA